MKKIFFSIIIIAVVSASAIGSSIAYFSDQEKSENNKFTAGTIEISVNDQTYWSQSFSWNDARPGAEFEINLAIRNNGQNPVKIWKAIKNVQTAEAEITAPEQNWYDENNNGEPKNDLDTAIIYEMLVEGNLIVPKEAKIKMSQIKDHYLDLSSLEPGETITVAQKYLMDEQTGNWAQSDTMSFEIEILAQQVDAPEPQNLILLVKIDEAGGDLENQYGYQHDYLNLSTVTFTYQNPMPDKIIGTIFGSGLKPFQTYQVKLVGIPICIDAVNGDNAANEYIGYQGRWSCIDCNGDPAGNNRTDAQYEANKLLPDGDPDKECIAGYLVFDFFTADAAGNISAADLSVQSDTSYHVLWCDSDAGSCNTDNSNEYLSALDPAHPGVMFCPADKVNGEPEGGRGGCDGLVMNTGNYYLQLVLTEETFHQSGNWASVLQKNISFEVN